jgi:hypothetical protein
MAYNWLDKSGPLDADALRELAAQVASYLPRVQQIERFWTDPAQRQVQYFICILEDPQAPCQQRMGWLPKLAPPVTRQAMFEDAELSLRVQLTLIERRIQARLGDVWTPSLWALFGNNHCTGAFGCREEFPDPNQYPWVRPVVQKPEDVRGLKPDLDRSPTAQRILAAIRDWRERTGGLIPIRAPEIEGPDTAASQVLGSILAPEMALTHPEEIRHFLRLYTGITRQWVARQLAAAADAVYWGSFHIRLPAGWICAAADSLVLYSPRHIREFFVPYYTQLLQGFQGLVLHYCGGNTHLLPVLQEIPGFKGVDSQFDMQQYPRARHILGPEPVILSLIIDGPPGSNEVRPEYLREYLEMIRGDRTVIWLRTKTVDEARRLEEMIHRYGR